MSIRRKEFGTSCCYSIWESRRPLYGNAARQEQPMGRRCQSAGVFLARGITTLPWMTKPPLSDGDVLHLEVNVRGQAAGGAGERERQAEEAAGGWYVDLPTKN